MKLFFVSRTDIWDYDEHDSFVIACETEDEARNADPYTGKQIENWNSGFSTWTTFIEKVKVQYLGEADSSVAKGIVCSSFNAG